MCWFSMQPLASVLVNLPLWDKKSRGNGDSPCGVLEGPAGGPSAPDGATVLAWRGLGVRGLHVCTNSPWIGEGLTPRAWPRHRVTLGCCQLEGRGSPLLVVGGSEGEPLASAPIGHHVSCPYVKWGAVWRAGGAVAGCHPTRLAAGLTGERRQAAPAIQGLGAAGIAVGASGDCGQVMLLLFLTCILLSTLLAAVILRGECRGPPLSGLASVPLLRLNTRRHVPQAKIPSPAKCPFPSLLPRVLTPAVVGRGREAGTYSHTEDRSGGTGSSCPRLLRMVPFPPPESRLRETPHSELSGCPKRVECGGCRAPF